MGIQLLSCTFKIAQSATYLYDFATYKYNNIPQQILESFRSKSKKEDDHEYQVWHFVFIFIFLLTNVICLTFMFLALVFFYMFSRKNLYGIPNNAVCG